MIQLIFIVSPFFIPGGYIYVEASEPQMYGHKSLLMGPRMCGRMCMRFFYSMNGRRMGTLNVYKREGMRRDDLLWTMSGHQGTEWHEALVDIGGACYQVRVYGHEDTVQKPVKSRLGLSWRRFFRSHKCSRVYYISGIRIRLAHISKSESIYSDTRYSL